jgi:hypothetical protein
MAHLHFIENQDGDVEDQLVFCSDFCHRSYCQEHDGLSYGGWNGCHEISTAEPCAYCEETVQGVNDEGDLV